MSAHHAYLVTGDVEAGIESGLAFVHGELGLETVGNPDVTVLRYGLFSVEEARMFQDVVMRAPTKGDKKVVIVSTTRFFYQAQNALLKTFEEPPSGTVIILVVPHSGILLPTLRSRLVSLPNAKGTSKNATIYDSEPAADFLRLDAEGREKFVAKLLERAKSDKDNERAAARADAAAFVGGLARAAYAKAQTRPSLELTALLEDLDRFAPLMHESSAPLKQIFEHLLIVAPKRF